MLCRRILGGCQGYRRQHSPGDHQPRFRGSRYPTLRSYRDIQPAERLSFAEKEKESSENRYGPINRKLPTGGASSGRDIVAFLSILSVVESVESIVRELVALSARLTMLRCVTVRIRGIHKRACGGGHCQCTSELCSHACSLSQEYHMKRRVIPRLCSERGSVAPSIPLAGHLKGESK